MKKQITRLSPHQNGKVFGILTAISSLIFIVPFGLIAAALSPQGSGPSAIIFLLFPIVYLIFGYVMVAGSCWFYNIMFRHVGGIEFEATESDA